MAYSYKLLTGESVLLLKELLAVFGEAFNDKAAYQNAVPGDNYLKSLLNKDHFIAITALEKGSVVGGLAAYVLDKFEMERKEIYIYDLAVAEPHRRRGIARNLISTLKQVGAKKGAYIIYVQADKGDDAAIQLYKSLGTQEDVYHFDIPVVPNKFILK